MAAIVEADSNEKSRQRLEELCAKLTDEQLACKTPDGWTVSATLAHLAFWERFTVERWKLFVKEPVATPVNADLINDSEMPAWHAIPGRDAIRLALEAATTADLHIAQLPDEIAAAARPVVNPRLFERFHHRNEHTAAIAAVVEAC